MTLLRVRIIRRVPIPAIPTPTSSLGAANSYSQNRNAPFNNVSLEEFDFYLQDNFRVNSRLTLNMGRPLGNASLAKSGE